MSKKENFSTTKHQTSLMLSTERLLHLYFQLAELKVQNALLTLNTLQINLLQKMIIDKRMLLTGSV